MSNFDLFTYPAAAGFKGAETSFEAARSIDAKTLQRLVLAQLYVRPMTADEIADRLGIDKLSIRPRCSELKAQGKLTDSGIRRENASGKRAIVYRLVA